MAKSKTHSFTNTKKERPIPKIDLYTHIDYDKRPDPYEMLSKSSEGFEVGDVVTINDEWSELHGKKVIIKVINKEYGFVRVCPTEGSYWDRYRDQNPNASSWCGPFDCVQLVKSNEKFVPSVVVKNNVQVIVSKPEKKKRKMRELTEEQRKVMIERLAKARAMRGVKKPTVSLNALMTP